MHRYGPSGPVRLLAIHGLTGHGKRWQPLANQHLAEIAVAAPDLIGHGRSSWAAPWTIDANVAALTALLKREADGPVVVVAHSFGSAVALHLAATHPDRVAALVLLDPAIGLDGERTREIADAMLASPTTRTPPKPVPRRPPAPGQASTRPCSTPKSTTTWSRCRAGGTVGASACPR